MQTEKKKKKMRGPKDRNHTTYPHFLNATGCVRCPAGVRDQRQPLPLRSTPVRDQGSMAPAPYRMVALVCGLSLFHGGSAWLPVSPRAGTTARSCRSTQLRAASGGSGGGGGRPDLVSMKRLFETSMDSKLIMEYVTVSFFEFAPQQ